MNHDDEPPNPFGTLTANATMMHELYSSLIAAGFTEPQALYLLAQMMSGGKGTPPT